MFKLFGLTCCNNKFEEANELQPEDSKAVAVPEKKLSSDAPKGSAKPDVKPVSNVTVAKTEIKATVPPAAAASVAKAAAPIEVVKKEEVKTVSVAAATPAPAVKPVETKPATESKPVETAKPAEVPKPVETAKPAEAAKPAAAAAAVPGLPLAQVETAKPSLESVRTAEYLDITPRRWSSMTADQKEEERKKIQQSVNDFVKEMVSGIPITKVARNNKKYSRKCTIDTKLTMITIHGGRSGLAGIPFKEIKEIVKPTGAQVAATDVDRAVTIELPDRSYTLLLATKEQRDRFYTCTRILRQKAQSGLAPGQSSIALGESKDANKQ